MYEINMNPVWYVLSRNLGFFGLHFHRLRVLHRWGPVPAWCDRGTSCASSDRLPKRLIEYHKRCTIPKGTPGPTPKKKKVVIPSSAKIWSVGSQNLCLSIGFFLGISYCTFQISKAWPRNALVFMRNPIGSLQPGLHKRTHEWTFSGQNKKLITQTSQGAKVLIEFWVYDLYSAPRLKQQNGFLAIASSHFPSSQLAHVQHQTVPGKPKSRRRIPKEEVNGHWKWLLKNTRYTIT